MPLTTVPVLQRPGHPGGGGACRTKSEQCVTALDVAVQGDGVPAADQAASITGIAAEAGVDRRTVYRRFTSREELLAAIHEARLAAIERATAEARLREAPVAAPGTRGDRGAAQARKLLLQLSGRDVLVRLTEHEEPRVVSRSSPPGRLGRTAALDGPAPVTLPENSLSMGLLAATIASALARSAMVSDHAKALLAHAGKLLPLEHVRTNLGDVYVDGLGVTAVGQSAARSPRPDLG